MFELLFKTTTLLVLSLGIDDDHPIMNMLDEITLAYDNDLILEAENMLRELSSKIIEILEK